MGDVTNLSPSPQGQVDVPRVDYDRNCDRFRVLPSCYPRSHYSVRVVRITLLKAAAIGLSLLRGQRQSQPSAASVAKTGFRTQLLGGGGKGLIPAKLSSEDSHGKQTGMRHEGRNLSRLA